jgi:hypothetical protein
MTSKTATKDKHRRTTGVPVTTMEQIAFRSREGGSARLLERSEACAKAGQAVDLDPIKFKKRLLDIFRVRIGPRTTPHRRVRRNTTRDPETLDL